MKRFKDKFEPFVWSMITIVLTVTFMTQDYDNFWQGIGLILIYLTFEKQE